ncbi:member RAS oncogene family [Seminavis robusta]|uniref:Member RAS oncogene family n=1 Tax=Seminavis robusta TaxID=568900 RepID=A0A9N8EM42_9STRA|nr:member RAS oncogene family [Seminavis robusta]|eukprot:Sro1205_g252260.1 member RAS oncogene family (3048) ;mRNA; r:6872-16015
MSQKPLHYAFVSSSEPLPLPPDDDDRKDEDRSAQDSLLSLYQSYAERFPNPRLIEEYQERDQLLQATSAAHAVARRSSSQQQQQQQQQSQGWFGFLFGSSSSSSNSSTPNPNSLRPPTDEENEWLEYTENEEQQEDALLCGTHHHSLDRSCIPPDAHSMARLLLASQRTQGERPLMVRTSPQLPNTSTMCIVGLGVIAEYNNSEQPTTETENDPDFLMNAHCSITSDRDDLLRYAGPRGGFDLSLTRAVSLGPNFLLVSWGFQDGVVVFYRRIFVDEQSPIAWEAVVFLGPSQAVLEHSFDLFADEDGEEGSTDLLRVTDMVPLCLWTPGIPAAGVVVSRLGGYMEVLPLPPSLWHGAILPPERHNPRKRQPSPHYAKGIMVNVASENVPIPIIALTTFEYHADVISVEAIRTRVPLDAVWDQEFYGKAPPPAHFILVASGTQLGHEVLTFWAISFVFPGNDQEPPHPDSAGFTMRALLQEALDVEAMGADLSVFCNRAILNQWRHPRKVALKERPPPPAPMDGSETGEDADETTTTMPDVLVEDDVPKSVYDRVTTITTSAPIVAMQAIVVTNHDDGTPAAVMLSLLDWNGSVTIMDCSLLERMVSHSLSEEEYRAIHDADMAAAVGDEAPPLQIALVKTVMDRSKMMQSLCRGNAGAIAVPHCVNAQWLARADDPLNPWLFLLTSNDNNNNNNKQKCQVKILSGFLQLDVNNPRPSIQSVPFPFAKAALQGTPILAQEDGMATPLRILFPVSKQRHSKLCMCFLQPLRPHDIIMQLTRDAKYEQAIEASQQVSDEERKLVTTVLEECRQKLWEQTWDMKWLKQVTSDSYIIQQAFSLFDSASARPEDGEEHKFENGGVRNNSENNDLRWEVDLEICREICTLALGRTGKIRLASALALGQGGDDAKEKLQGILVRLGTYQLLCQAINAEASFAKFRDYFVPVSMVDLAKSFASVADLAALSILFFRHRHELKPNFLEILGLLPLTTSPGDYCYLLPVLEKTQQREDPDRTDLFIKEIAPAESETMLHVSQLPSYLKEAMDFKIVLSGNDEKMVLECNSAAASNNNECGFEVPSLLAFFESRVMDMQLFVGNLEHVASFCAAALLSIGASQNNDGWVENGVSSESLVCTWGSALALERMLEESLGEAPPPMGEENGVIDLSPFATVTPLDLWSMDLVDVVGMVLGGQDDTATIYQIHKQHLAPLMKYLPGGTNKNLDRAISDYCIKVVKTSTGGESASSSSSDLPNEEHKSSDINQVRETFVEALRICAAVAFGSRPSITKSGRIIQDKSIAIELVHQTIEEAAARCQTASIPTKACAEVVDLMWKLYESLPVGSTEERKASSALSKKSDQLYQHLVGVAILSQWPGCHEEAFAFLADRIQLSKEYEIKGNSEIENMLHIGGKAMMSLCRSYCSQVKASKGSNGLPDLLQLVISDLEQFHAICYEGAESFLPTIVHTISSDLIAPLSRKGDFNLVAQILSSVDKSWWDQEREARIVGAYVDSIVFADSDSDRAGSHLHSDSALQAAIACQDALGPLFPDLQEGFQLSRRYLDAANFISTEIFAELKVRRTVGPNDLRDDPPVDVVESILKALPKAIIIKCHAWGDESLAVHANKALRNSQQNQALHQSEEVSTELPPIPGGAIFHLASILGLENTASVLVVKSRVVHHGVAAGLFGASAAVCRTMLHDKNAFSSEVDAVARISAVAEVVSRQEYGDLATKEELCSEAMKKFQASTTIYNCQPLDDILRVYTALEPRINQSKQNESSPPILNLQPPSDSIGNLYHDSWSQYSINIYDLLWTLRVQAQGCSIDDTLLNAICRYVFFCCIFRSTRPRTTQAGTIEKATANQLLIFGAALLLQTYDWKAVSGPAIKELREIVEKQTIAIINQHPKAFQEPFMLPNIAIVRQLVSKGFPPMAACRSALATNNAGFQQALNWGIANAKNPGMNDPVLILASTQGVFVEKSLIQQVVDTFAFVQKFLSGSNDLSEWMADNMLSTKVAFAPEDIRNTVDLPNASKEVAKESRITNGKPDQRKVSTGNNANDHDKHEADKKAREAEKLREEQEARRTVAEEKERQEAAEKRRKEEEARRMAAEEAKKQEEVAKKEAEDRARQEAAAKQAAEAKARQEEAAKKEAEDRARQEAAARKASEVKTRQEKAAKKEAEEKKRQEEAAKKEAEERALKEAAAKREAEEIKQHQEAAKKEAEERARKEAAAKREAEEKKRQEAAKKEAEDRARKEAAVAAKRAAEEKKRQEAAAKREAEERARREAAAAAKKAAEEKKRQEAAAKREAEERARREATATAKKAAEEKKRQEEAAKKEAEGNARKKAEAERLRLAEAKAKAEEARQKAEAERLRLAAQKPKPSIPAPVGSNNLSIDTDPAASAMATSTAPTSANGFITPTNRPTSLHLGLSTGSSAASNRSALKLRGEAALGALKSTPRNKQVDLEERRRLIEAGRRLLAKSRAKNTTSPSSASSMTKGASTGQPTSVTSAGTSPIIGSPTPPKVSSATASTSSSATSSFFGFSKTPAPPPPPPPKVTPATVAPPPLPPKAAQLMSKSSKGFTVPPSAPPPPRAPPIKKAAAPSTSSRWTDAFGFSPAQASNPAASVAPPPPPPAPVPAPQPPPRPQASALPSCPRPGATQAPMALASQAKVPSSSPPLSTSLIAPAETSQRQVDEEKESGWDFDADGLDGSGSASNRAPSLISSKPKGQVSEPKPSEKQGDWGWGAEDDGLGDLDNVDPSPPVAPLPPPAQAKAPLEPPAPVPMSFNVEVHVEATANEGGDWGWGADDDDGLGDLDEETAQTASALPPPPPNPPAPTRAVPPPLAPAPAITNTESAQQLDARDNQGGDWGWGAEDDGLGDLDEESNRTPLVHVPPRPAPTILNVDSAKDSGWGPEDDGLADLDDDPVQTTMANPVTVPVQTTTAGSESQGDWGWGAEDDGLGDLGDETPLAPLVAPKVPVPASSMATSQANPESGWGDDDALGDLDGSEGGGGWGFEDDNISSHPVAAPNNEEATGVDASQGGVTRLEANDDDDGGWDFDDF